MTDWIRFSNPFLRPRAVPRVGIADPRVRQTPRPMVPPRPDVREPAVCSLAVQQLVDQAEKEARASLEEEKSVQAFSDPEAKRELYDLGVFFIDRGTPKSGWSTSPSVDRAEARLKLWGKIFGGRTPNPGDVRQELGEEPMLLDATRLLSPAVVRDIEPKGVFFFQRNRAWMLRTDEHLAERVARSAHKGLVGKRSLTAADPFLHHRTLYVAYPGGYIKVEGPPEKARDTEKSDKKYKILFKGKDVFGSQGVKLSGSEGSYTLELLPARKEFRGKFRATKITVATLEEVEKKLDEAIDKVAVLL